MQQRKMQQWPAKVEWNTLRFGVEIEFVGGRPAELELMPGWNMALDEYQIDENGDRSGSELQTPPLVWAEREQIRVMLERLLAQGAHVNWSCGLHVHVGIEAWGEALVVPMLEAALRTQDALRELVGMSEERLIYCPPVTEAMLAAYRANSTREALRSQSRRPQSHRCGINAAAWYDNGTVEIRYANGSLDVDEILRTVGLCLRFVASVGAGHVCDGDSQCGAEGRAGVTLGSVGLSGAEERSGFTLGSSGLCGSTDRATLLAKTLGVPTEGYPAAKPVPNWQKERTLLEESLIPTLADLAERHVPGGEILRLVPVPEGLAVDVEAGDGNLRRLICPFPATGWRLISGD